MGSLLNSFKITKLDLEDSKPSRFIYDTITRYSRFNTGTPNLFNNPEAAAPFILQFTPSKSYMDYIRSDYYLENGKSRLLGRNYFQIKYSIFDTTNLDIESPERPNSWISYYDPTEYPKYTTGTPYSNANPGPADSYYYKLRFSPSYEYLDEIKDSGGGPLGYSFSATNLDVENYSPDGGIPYSTLKDPTQYSKYITGTPTTRANPGPFGKFKHPYNPSKVYVDNVSISKSKLLSSVASTNLDVENPQSNGGIPYKTDKDPTIYPEYVTGIPDQSPSKFYQWYLPGRGQRYMDDDGIGGFLDASFGDTNLDLEDGSPDGGIPYKEDKDPTEYPKYVTGVPAPNKYPGAPRKFYPGYDPSYGYIDGYLDSGRLGILEDYSFSRTNLDIEDKYPNGGIPYKQDKDPTSPKNDLTTGPPASDGIPGPFSKFNQIWEPKKTYLQKYPIKNESSPLYPTNHKPKVRLDNSSNASYVALKNSLNLAPDYRRGSVLLHYIIETPRNQPPYVKYDVYDFTKYDRESPKALLYGNTATGGIPYKSSDVTVDPTIYPVTTLKRGSVKGYNVVVGQGASKYDQPFEPNDTTKTIGGQPGTYLNFIKDYI